MNTTKICRVCSHELTKKNTYTVSKGNICKSCYRTYQQKLQKKKYADNPDIVKATVKAHRDKIKREVLGHYSKDLTCVKCKFDDLRALSIDHIDSGGCKHRKELGNTGGTEFYRWLKKEGYPEGFQVLCMNCQFIKRIELTEFSQ